MTTAPHEKRDYSKVVTWMVGLLGLIVLGMVLLSPLEWTLKLAAWIVLVWLLDECGNWFGYSGVALGALPFFAGWIDPFVDVAASPPQWDAAFPLVASGLIAGLLVKHAGGWFGLLLAIPVFLAPMLVVRQFGSALDETLTLPKTEEFFTWSLWPAIAGAVLGALLRLLLNRQHRSRQGMTTS